MVILSTKSLIFIISLLPMILLISTVLAAPQIEIVSHTSYLESTEGLFTIIGEVQNIGDQPATNVDITATYYNADNEVISDLGGPIVDLDVLLPGRKSPFGSTDLTTDPQLIDHYSLDVSFTPCDPKPEKLEIISHSSTIDPYYGYMHIIGEVENSGDLQGSLVHVVATCYNEAGTVVDFSDDYVVTVNQKADFDIIILGELPDPISSYRLTAQTVDYAAPEYLADVDIANGEEETFESTQFTQEMREPSLPAIVLPVGVTVVAVTAFLVTLGPAFSSSISNLPVPKQVKSFLKFYGGSLFKKVDKIELDVINKAPFLTKAEFLSLGISISLLTIVYAIVEANGFPNFLNPAVITTVIPSTFLSVGIVNFTKLLSDAFWNHTYKVYKQLNIWIIGVLMFIISGLLLLFPFSSPGITRYQSNEISKKTKGLLVMLKTFTVLTLLIPFSILFMLGYQVIGDSGSLLTLMSTCYSLIPLKFLAGRSLFDYRKEISMVMLFSVGFLFYGCTINLLPQPIYFVTGVVSMVIALLTERKLRKR